MLTPQATGEAIWLGKRVRQVSGIPELVGRVGVVTEVIIDEKGVFHCLCERPIGTPRFNDGTNDFWCPIHHLRIVESC